MMSKACKILRAALKDEKDGVAMYHKLAKELDRVGEHGAAGTFNRIASQEKAHGRVVKRTIDQVCRR